MGKLMDKLKEHDPHLTAISLLELWIDIFWVEYNKTHPRFKDDVLQEWFGR